MADATIDTRPDRVNLYGYAGDTLSFHVQCPVGFLNPPIPEGGSYVREWIAQVRSADRQGQIDATFQITENVDKDGNPDPDGAVITLTGASTRTLGELGTPVKRGSTVLTYVGAYDVQIGVPDGLGGFVDPIDTVVQGEVKIDLDVTRLVELTP